MSTQIVVEIHRFKITQDIWKTSSSRKIIAFAESTIKNKTFRSVECRVSSGSQYCLPWSDSITAVSLHFYYIDALLSVEIGSSVYELAQDRKFVSDGSSARVILDIMLKGSQQRVGKVVCDVSVQNLFDGPGRARRQAPRHETQDQQLNLADPDFRFKRLTRSVNWERVRGLQLDRVVQTADTRSLLACLDDVVCGDVSQEGMTQFMCMLTAKLTALLPHRRGPEALSRAAAGAVQRAVPPQLPPPAAGQGEARARRAQDLRPGGAAAGPEDRQAAGPREGAAPRVRGL